MGAIMPTHAPPKHQVCNLVALRRQLQTLATLPVTEAPLFSLFLDLRTQPTRLRHDFKRWAQAARSTLDESKLKCFDAAVTELEKTLHQKWPREVRSVAVYARAGEPSLLVVLPFAAVMETAFHVAEMPTIFPLVQMKDRFHRFVVAISTEDYARVVEITLGAVSEEILTTRPEMRKRIGREWTREHYHQHRYEAGKRFLKEQAEIIRNLMSKRGINHLILAGSHQAVSRLNLALPKGIEARVVDALYRIPSSSDCPQVLDEAIGSFIDFEQDETHAVIEILHERVRSNGLAVVGIEASRQAMELGAASELVISSALPSEQLEPLVRMATAAELPIETCNHDSLLDSHGGVGCLLRYQPQL